MLAEHTGGKIQHNGVGEVIFNDDEVMSRFVTFPDSGFSILSMLAFLPKKIFFVYHLNFYGATVLKDYHMISIEGWE